jgi:hypothetical protein
MDVHYLESVGVPAATVVAADAAFSQAHMPQAGRGGAVVTGGHERVEAARLGWFHVHAQGGLTELVTPVMLEVLATPGLLVSTRSCPDLWGLSRLGPRGWRLPAVRSAAAARLAVDPDQR